jgi:DNA-binding transcriptional ArsR family regulator
MSRSSHAEPSASMPEDGRPELIAAAMADPVRSKIFVATSEPTFFVASEDSGKPVGISVREIAERVQESRRRVKYHLEVLCRQGLVEIVEERRRRGVVEHFYRATSILMLSKEEMEGLPVRRQQTIILAVLKEIFADATAALESGTYIRRPEWATARLHADVDDQGWTELAALYEKSTRDALEVIAKAKERLRGTDQKPIRIGAASLLFEASARNGTTDHPSQR